MYRPERIDYSKAEDLMLVKDSYEWSLVEAGADAMLEGLRANAERFKEWEPVGKNGYLIFIPEEE